MSNTFEYASISTRYYQFILDMFNIHPEKIFDKKFRPKKFSFECSVNNYPTLTVTGWLDGNLEHSYTFNLEADPVVAATQEEYKLTPRVVYL